MDQIRILVVDDNHINRLYLTTILTQWQHHVTEVDSGAAALSVCQKQPFDLILMDIRMQPMDGVTAAAEIKQLKPHYQTPIIAVSAEQINCAPYPQFIDSLMKPLNKINLERLLRKYTKAQPLINSPFDEAKALAISHNDIQIVNKLRQMFTTNLATEIKKIEALQKAESWIDLDNQLHYLQGSARVCAAVILTEKIEDYRQQLTTKNFSDLNRYLSALTRAATDIMALEPH